MKPPRKNRQPARKSIPSAAGSSRSGPKNSSRGQKRKARNTTPGAMENVSIHRSPINLMQPQLAEVGPPHHNTVRQPSVDLSNRVEDRNRSAQLTEGSNSDTRPVNSDGPAGSTNDTQKVGIGVEGRLVPPLAWMHHCSRVGLINLGTLILIIVCRFLRGVIPFQWGFRHQIHRTAR
jgi:hypothetical protein